MKNKNLALAVLLGAALTGTAIGGLRANASDHDDGTTDIKAQNSNLTDVYVFRKDRATGNIAHADTLVAVVNVNPRSLPRQNYFFNTRSEYKLHFSNVGTNLTPGTLGAVDNEPAGTDDDFLLTYSFGAADSSNQQAMTLRVNRGTSSLTTTGTVMTTPASDADLDADTNSAALAGGTFTVAGTSVKTFAGLRQDPFYFDVERFFMVRDRAVEIAAGSTEAVAQSYIGFNTTGVPAADGSGGAGGTGGKDFVANYNCLSTVFELPISLIAGAAAGPTVPNVFDTWATVHVKSL